MTDQDSIDPTGATEPPPDESSALLEGSLAGRAGRGFVALAGGRAVAAVFEFAGVAILAAHLGPGRMGVYSFAVTLALLFKLLPTFGFPPVVSRDIVQDPARERFLIPNLMYLQVLLGAVAYALMAATVAVAYSPANRDAALAAGVLLLLFGLDSFQIILQVRLRMGWVSVANTAQSVANLVAIIALATSGAGVMAFVWLYVLIRMTGFAAVALVAVRATDLSWRLRPRLWLPLLKEAAPLAASGLLIALYINVDVAILAAFKPSAAVGQYGTAVRFLFAFLSLPPLVMSVVGPALARSIVDGREVLQRRFGRTIHLLGVAAIPVSVAGAMTAWRLLPATPGFDKYAGAGVALAILAPAAGMILINTVVQGVLVSGRQQGRLLKISAAGLVANLALNGVLIPAYSYVGAAVATTLTEVAVITLSLREVRRQLDVRIPVERLSRVAVAGAGMAVVAAATYGINPFVQLALVSAAYLGGLLALRGVTKAEVTDLMPSFARR